MRWPLPPWEIGAGFPLSPRADLNPSFSFVFLRFPSLFPTMPRLSDDAQLFIVQRLAMFDGPMEIVSAAKDDLGLEISPEQVRHYDPERPDAQVAKKWRALHAHTRAAFLKEMMTIPLAHRAVRIRELTKLFEDAKRRKNVVLAAALLEQIAKEVGDAYTNKREHSGPGGTPIRHSLDVRFVKGTASSPDVRAGRSSPLD